MRWALLWSPFCTVHRKRQSKGLNATHYARLPQTGMRWNLQASSILAFSACHPKIQLERLYDLLNEIQVSCEVKWEITSGLKWSYPEVLRVHSTPGLGNKQDGSAKLSHARKNPPSAAHTPAPEPQRRGFPIYIPQKRRILTKPQEIQVWILVTHGAPEPDHPTKEWSRPT